MATRQKQHVDRERLQEWQEAIKTNGGGTVPRPAIEAAFHAHLTTLSQPVRPLRWHDDIESAFFDVYHVAKKAAEHAAENAAWEAARTAVIDTAWEAAWDARWSVAWEAGWSVAREAAHEAGWDTVREAARETARGVIKTTAMSIARNAAWDVTWDTARDVAWDGRTSFAPLTMISCHILLFWVRPTEILAVPKPRMCYDSSGRLHCAHGKAVEFPSGNGYYFWHGVHVPAPIMCTPEQLTMHDIAQERNAEIRRVMIARLGILREQNYWEEEARRGLH